MWKMNMKNVNLEKKIKKHLDPMVLILSDFLIVRHTLI